jgi:hypothetical protein
MVLPIRSHRYLRARQRAVELVAAFYAAGYAAFIGIIMTLTDDSPLRWTGLSETQQFEVGSLMMAAGVTHATGIYVNGSWRWSPALRVVGLSLHLVVISSIAIAAPVTSSAFYNYAAIAAMLAIGVMNALQDVQHARGIHGTSAT